MGKLKVSSNNRVLRLNFPVTFLGFLDTHMLIPVIALYASDLGASPGIVGLVVGLYSITNTPANVFFGRIIDKLGHKIPLIIGLFGDTVGMFAYTLCNIPLHLAIVRVFHGISGGMVGPATMSITARYSSTTDKGKAMSFYGMSLGLATLVGYGMSGVIMSRLGYHPLFYIGAALLLIGVVLAFLMPIQRPAVRRRDSGSFTQDFRKVMDLLKRKELIASYCAIFAQYFAFGGIVTLLPLYVRDLGLEAYHVGLLLSLFSLAFLMFQFAGGILSDRVGRRMPAAAGLAIGAIVLIALPFSQTLATLITVMMLYGTAYALLFPSISALIADHTAPEEHGKATGLFHALLTGGVAIGAPVMGWIAQTTGLQSGITLTPIVLILALVISLITLRGKRSQVQQPDFP